MVDFYLNIYKNINISKYFYLLSFNKYFFYIYIFLNKHFYFRGAVALDGRIEPGDMILQVNDINFENMSNDQAVRVLRDVVQTPGYVLNNNFFT